MKFIKHILVVALTVFSITGCESDKDESGPEIIINIPQQGREYVYGDDVNINFTMNDDNGIAVYKYVLSPVETAGVKYTKEESVTLTNYVTSLTTNEIIELPFQYDTNTLYTDGAYELKILAEDFENNVSTKTIQLFIKNDTLE